jgi:hypothetical protein
VVVVDEGSARFIGKELSGVSAPWAGATTAHRERSIATRDRNVAWVKPVRPRQICSRLSRSC